MAGEARSLIGEIEGPLIRGRCWQ